MKTSIYLPSVLLLIVFSCQNYKQRISFFSNQIVGSWQIDKIVYRMKDGSFKEHQNIGIFHFDKFEAGQSQESYCYYKTHRSNNLTEMGYKLYATSNKPPYPEGKASVRIYLSPEEPSNLYIGQSNDIVLRGDKMFFYRTAFQTFPIPDSTLTEIHFSKQ